MQKHQTEIQTYTQTCRHTHIHTFTYRQIGVQKDIQTGSDTYTAYRHTDRKKNKQADRTYRHKQRHTNTQADIHTYRPADSHTDRLTYTQRGKQSGRQAGTGRGTYIHIYTYIQACRQSVTQTGKKAGKQHATTQSHMQKCKQ